MSLKSSTVAFPKDCKNKNLKSQTREGSHVFQKSGNWFRKVSAIEHLRGFVFCFWRHPWVHSYMHIHILQNTPGVVLDMGFPLLTSHSTGSRQALSPTASHYLQGEPLLMEKGLNCCRGTDKQTAHQSVNPVSHLSACLMTYSYLSTQSECILSIPIASGKQPSQFLARRSSLMDMLFLCSASSAVLYSSTGRLKFLWKPTFQYSSRNNLCMVIERNRTNSVKQ